MRFLHNLPLNNIMALYKGMDIFFQTIHPVEFPEGNPIQQGRLGSICCPLITDALRP